MREFVRETDEILNEVQMQQDIDFITELITTKKVWNEGDKVYIKRLIYDEQLDYVIPTLEKVCLSHPVEGGFMIESRMVVEEMKNKRMDGEQQQWVINEALAALQLYNHIEY